MEISIDKIINNNIISSQDESGREIIIMGRGIGFRKRKGEFIDEAKVEKIFTIDNPVSMDRYKDLVATLPWEYIEASNKIISFATEKLNVRLNQNVYLTLTDHISFVIDRFKEGMFFPNTLYGEIKRFYPEEFAIANQALEFIYEATGIKLPQEEAASISIHLVNAEFNSKVQGSWTMTNIMQDILMILERADYVPEKESLNGDLLLSNLKFLVHRILLLPPQTAQQDEVFTEFIKTHCVKEYSLANQVQQYVYEKHGCMMTEQEKIFMTELLKNVKLIINEKREENNGYI